MSQWITINKVPQESGKAVNLEQAIKVEFGRDSTTNRHFARIILPGDSTVNTQEEFVYDEDAATVHAYINGHRLEGSPEIYRPD